jgi:predicted nuclease of predicted toxin-antitoxin system
LTTQRSKPSEPKKLRLYLDQMFALDVAQELSEQGYDVMRASETGQARADDEKILKKAISENRILITLDEHFGDWVILPLNRHPGIIRLRVHPTTKRAKWILTA